MTEAKMKLTGLGFFIKNESNETAFTAFVKSFFRTIPIAINESLD